MSKTLRFARLDFITIKPYLTWKNLLLLLGIALVMQFGGGGSPASISMIMAFGFTYISYPFAVGEKNGIDALYATLPITRKTVVAGRYVFSLILNILVAAIGVLTILVFSVVFKAEFAAIEILMVTLVSIVIFGVIQAMQLPIYFKLGYAKAKFAAFLPFGLVPLLVLILSRLSTQMDFGALFSAAVAWISNNLGIFGIWCALIWAVGIVLSYFVSVRFYLKREF